VRCAPFSCFFLDRDLRIEGSMTSSEQRRNYNNFENSKNQCLGKRDKSSAGRIDPHVVEICAVLNELPAYYTTSSCAGRSFLYKGPGIKSTLQFERFRVNHDKINDPVRYFDLSTLESDPTGGGDPIRSVGQYDHAERLYEEQQRSIGASVDDRVDKSSPLNNDATNETTEGNSVWLRFEPFILHLACRSLGAASALMAAARPAFKVRGC
jgi:tRNA(Phe) wybutosine-synthesizing methylase Tyw3